MAEFASTIDAWVQRVKENRRAVYLNYLSAIRDSIQHGSPITAAPGQPIDTGRLLGSWDIIEESEWQSMIATGLKYARSIEEGQQGPYTLPSGTRVTPRPIVFRSAVGGAHSVALTRTNAQALLDDVVARTVGAQP